MVMATPLRTVEYLRRLPGWIPNSIYLRPSRNQMRRISYLKDDGSNECWCRMKIFKFINTHNENQSAVKATGCVS